MFVWFLWIRGCNRSHNCRWTLQIEVPCSYQNQRSSAPSFSLSEPGSWFLSFRTMLVSLYLRRDNLTLVIIHFKRIINYKVKYLSLGTRARTHAPEDLGSVVGEELGVGVALQTSHTKQMACDGGDGGGSRLIKCLKIPFNNLNVCAESSLAYGWADSIA